MVKPILEPINVNDVGIHAWLIHSLIKKYKKYTIQKKNNSKCTEFATKEIK